MTWNMCPVVDIFTSWRDSPGACRPASDNDSKREEFYFGQVICDAHHFVSLFVSILVLPGRTTHCEISLVPNPAPHSFIVNIKSVLIGCGCHFIAGLKKKSSFWISYLLCVSFLFVSLALSCWSVYRLRSSDTAPVLSCSALYLGPLHPDTAERERDMRAILDVSEKSF